MAFLLNEEFLPDSGDEIRQLMAQVKRGKLHDRQTAQKRLIKLQAESAFAELLADKDSLTVELASNGLWECWLNEKGPEARGYMDRGIAQMNAGELAEAASIFTALMARFPDWAEAINKQATILYITGEPAASMNLCRAVVKLKPHHFGAWNGMALCAVQVEDWITALRAAKAALKIQPTATANLEIIRLAQSHIC